jgi:hypothetical protein
MEAERTPWWLMLLRMLAIAALIVVVVVCLCGGALAAIAAGASVQRSATLRLPDGTTSVGDLRFTVTTDIYNHVFERTTASA